MNVEMSTDCSKTITKVRLQFPEHLLPPVDLLNFIYEEGFWDDWKDCGLSVENDLWALETAISADPESGRVIKGTGGLRKLRFGGLGKGKRGVRVIFMWIPEIFVAYMFMVYKKSEMDDISRDVADMLRAEAEGIRERLLTIYAR